MQTQHCGGALRQIQDPAHATVINGEGITGLDNPRQCPGGEGVGEREPHDLVLPMERDAHVERGRAARMGQGPLIQEADEARTLKAPPLPPSLVRGDAGRVALRGEGGLPLENGAQPVIAR